MQPLATAGQVKGLALDTPEVVISATPIGAVTPGDVLSTSAIAPEQDAALSRFMELLAVAVRKVTTPEPTIGSELSTPTTSLMERASTLDYKRVDEV